MLTELCQIILKVTLRDVLTIMERLTEAKAGFRSLTEAIDTTTPAGRMMMQMVGAFAEFERAMLRERTKAGLDSARREGRIGGRRPKLTDSTAVRNQEDGLKRSQDSSRCRPPVQSPPCNCLSAPREAEGKK
jgi:DNA invertase Pin-like site-specific DNA recombinase